MSSSDITYDWAMVRWEPDACGRLQHAALTLYGERGFESTTVAEIAEYAGLTKRTFFRYFADKREVLFWGAQALQELFVTAVAEAPESATPLEAVTAALDAAAAMFEERREFAAQRQQIINANPELLERERSKLASLAAAVADALRHRGVAEPAATLAADAGVTVFRVAFEVWLEPGNKRSLQQVIHRLLDELKTVTGGS
jgi:AcrR family transcriptional regulator